jgi:translation initiation factor 4E
MGRKGDGSSHSNKNPFNSPAIASPTAGASSAFGLGSGAFASFAKTPKTPGSALDFGGVLGSSTKTPTTEKQPRVMAANSSKPSLDDNMTADPQHPPAHPLQDSWSFWFRPPIPKPNGYGDDYAKSISQIATVATVEDFWLVYRHLNRPSTLPHVSDYHFFKAGIRPIWEDDDNKNGGKWIVKLKKGVADRYWEDLLLALVGNQFVGTNDEICGAVLSVRNGEDILSIWTRDESSGRVLKIKYVSFRLPVMYANC